MTVFLLVIGIVIVISGALVFCVAPGKAPPEAKRMSETFTGLNCAHRGLYTEDQQVPENSLPAFAAARNAGYGVELDVQLSKDGQVVVFHDDSLSRACGVSEPVNSLDWESLAALSLFGTKEHIPLLTKVLDVIGDSPVIVELKSAGAGNAALCRKTLDILRAQGKNWCVESFDPRIGGWFRKNAPDVLRGQLASPPRDYDIRSKVQAFLMGNLLVNFLSRPHFIAYSVGRRPPTVRLCLAMKPMTVIWTVAPEHNIAQCENENDAVIFEHYKPTPRYRN